MPHCKQDTKFNVDFIGIGSARSGTTWLAKVLQEHPDICISTPKELDFFSSRTLYLPTSNSEMSLDWYQSKFNHCHTHQLKGEFSPSYFVDPEAPKLIKEHFPNVKLILCLRNPVDALISHYQNIKIYHPMEWSFEEFLQNRPDFYGYYELDRHLRCYLQFFSLENIHIILYDDIVNNPADVVTNVLQWLGNLEFHNSEFLHKRVNHSSTAKSMYLRNFLSATKNILDQNIFIRKMYKTMKLDELGWKLVRYNMQPCEKITVDNKLKKDLLKYYSPHVQILGRMIGQDMSNWLHT